VFQQLNQYLFQFRVLCLPSFGTIRLVAQPARLDVVEHLIYAPTYEPNFSADDDDLSEHQLEYFTASLRKDEADVEAFFIKAGETLRSKVEQGAFNWGGIGTFNCNNDQIFLTPKIEALDAVPAQRVIREKTQHAVLVGDQVVMTDPAAERVVEEKRRRDVWVLIAWILTALAILFIAYYLYQHHFSPQASGLQTTIEPAGAQPTYQ
jgi:hypothetical protein